MISVSEAARRVRRDPETVRRWIRTGRVRARKIGTQHFIEESDLDETLAEEMLPLPKQWRRMANRQPMPNVARWVRRSRAGR